MKYRFKRRVLYTLLLCLDSLFLLLPLNIGLLIGAFFGNFAYIVLGEYRRLSKKHLKDAFNGVLSDEEASKIAKSCFSNLGKGFAEILSLPKIKKNIDKLISIQGIENIDRAFKEGKGVIAVTGHIGNWEFLPMYFAQKGYSTNVIARPIYYEKYNEWIMFLRKSMGVNIIFRTDSPRKILRLLKNNELVGIVPDQDIDSIEGVFVDFFGEKAFTPSAPVKLAMVSGSPIVPIFIIRESNDKHTIYVEEPIRVESSGNRELDLLFFTQKWSNVLESYVRKFPDQWVWMHKRWKTRPSL